MPHVHEARFLPRAREANPPMEPINVLGFALLSLAVEFPSVVSACRRAPDGSSTTRLVAMGVDPITVSPDEPRYGANMIASVDVDASSDPWTDDDMLIVIDGFRVPVSTTFDTQARLHLLDDVTGEVFEIDFATGEATLQVVLPSALEDLALGTEGALYVANDSDGSVGRVRPSAGREEVGPSAREHTPQRMVTIRRPNGTESLFVADRVTLRAFDDLDAQHLHAVALRADPAVADRGIARGAVGPPALPPTWTFNGVAVGAFGAIYVTGEIGTSSTASTHAPSSRRIDARSARVTGAPRL